ncbi:MAG: YcjF family protein [Hyphomicrobiales bacterium]
MTARKPRAVKIDADPESGEEKQPAPKPKPAPKQKAKPAAKPAAKKQRPATEARAPRAMKAPEAPPVDEKELPFDDPASKGALVPANHLPSARGLKWGAIFVSAVGALISLGIGLWFTQLVEQLFARSEWLGWAATGLMALAAAALVIIILREIIGVARLRRLTELRHNAEQALLSGKGGQTAAGRIRSFYSGRKDMAWPLSRLAAHDDEVLDGADWLKLTETELMAPLDGEAKRLIIKAAKRVSLITAVNPAPAFDILFTAAQVLRMLRQIAGLYGGRPGSVETLRLARMVVTHLSVTGGLALSDNLVQHLLGHGLAGRLSAKLGEGTVNGIMTARIGLAAMDVCRPMPYAAIPRPGLNEFLSELVGSFKGQEKVSSKED